MTASRGHRSRPSRRARAAPKPRRRRATWWAIGVFVVGAGVMSIVVPRARHDPSSQAIRNLPNPDLSLLQPRVAERLREARRRVQVQPESPNAWGYFGAVCDVHELYSKASTCYRQAAALDPNDFRWPYLLAYTRELDGADVEEIAPLLRRAAEIEPEFPPIFFRLGEAMMRQGQVGPACEAYRRALELDPVLAIAHRSLGQALLRLDDPRTALDHLQSALKYGGPDRAVFAAMGRAYTRLGNAEAAQEAIERSRRAPLALVIPDPVRYEVKSLGISAQHCYERGKDLTRRGEYEAAIEQLKIALEPHRTDPETQYHLGRAYWAAGQRQLATEHLLAAVRLRNDYVDAHLLLGSLLTNQGRTDDAIQHLRRALELAPDHAPAHYNLGRVLEELGRRDEAISHYRSALTIDPSNPAGRRLQQLGVRPP